MITPEMNFVLFMRFFYLWTIKSKASFKALAFHLSKDKIPFDGVVDSVTDEDRMCRFRYKSKVRRDSCFTRPLEVGRRLLKSLIAQLCLTFKRHIPPTNLS